MSNHVDWMLELAVADGKLDEFKTLIAEMVAATKADEPGALIYEYSVSADGGTVHIYERYADSAATLVHLGNFGKKFAPRFLSLAKPTRLTVYGNPDAAVRKALDSMGAVYMAPVDGFAR